MEIRAARKAERQACGDIYVRAGRAAFPWVDPELFQASEIAAWAEQGEELYLALEDGMPVAMMSFWRPDSFIHNLFVDPPAQGRGYGGALLAFAGAIADGPVSLKCDPLNQAAMRFYAHRGMTEAGHGVGPQGRPYVLFRQAALPG